jgi:hypothetical protein
MITDYATLQTEIAAFAYRDDLTAKIPTFIQLCEADMQVRCKLVDLESNVSIVLTSGVGPLPTGYTGARSVWYDGDQVRELKYITPNQLTAYDALAGLPTYYTIIGTDIHVIPSATGTVKMTYKARFTALSSTDTTNAILIKYPDAYLHGSLVQLAMYTKDADTMTTSNAAYEAAIKRIKTDDTERRNGGATLQVRAR